MTHEDRLKQIDEYFKNITIQEFETTLEHAGIDRIKSCKDSGYELVSSEMTDTMHDVYLDIKGVSLTKIGLCKLFYRIPKDIISIGEQWGWYDTEFGDMVFKWVRDNDIVIDKD